MCMCVLGEGGAEHEKKKSMRKERESGVAINWT